MSLIIPNGRPRFKSPPVVEVAASLGFAEIDAKTLATSLKDLQGCLDPKYTSVEFKHEMEERNGIVLEEINNNTKFSFPRYWFLTDDKIDLLQISHKKIGFNWRKLKFDDTNAYKTYDHVWKMFESGLLGFEKFCNEKEAGKIVPSTMELSYFNHIPFGDFGGQLSNIEKLLPALSWFKKAEWLKEPNAFTFAWNIPDPEANRNILLQAVTVADMFSGDPILRLEIVVKGGILGEGLKLNSPDFKKWYDEAHLLIVNTFSAITAEDLQATVWGKENENTN